MDKLIVENEQNGNIKAEYGKQVLKELSKWLIQRFGSGFSRSNLQNMRLFYMRYGKCQPLAGKFNINEKQQLLANILSWSHYCYLIYIEDDAERSFYEKECINCNWSIATD